MIDPKKLNLGDLVVFGGKIEKKVNWIYDSMISFGDTTVARWDPIWEIAELKNPELPKEVGYYNKNHNYELRDDGAYYQPKSLWPNGLQPSELLKHSRIIVSQLEKAGVE